MVLTYAIHNILPYYILTVGTLLYFDSVVFFLSNYHHEFCHRAFFFRHVDEILFSLKNVFHAKGPNHAAR